MISSIISQLLFLLSTFLFTSVQQVSLGQLLLQSRSHKERLHLLRSAFQAAWGRIQFRVQVIGFEA